MSAVAENALPTDAEPLIWAVSAWSIGRLFELDTWMPIRLAHVIIELTPARALSVTVEECEEDLYDALFLARLLTVRKRMSGRPNGQDRDRLNEPDIRRSCSRRSSRSATPRSTSPRSRRSRSSFSKVRFILVFFDYDLPLIQSALCLEHNLRPVS